MRIFSTDPVREAFAGCSTSSNYYETKGHAVSAFEAVLNDYGLRFDDSEIIDMPGDEGCVFIYVCSDEFECSEYVGRARLSYYRMPSGRYEFVGYLA